MKKYTTIFLTAILFLATAITSATAQNDVLSRTKQNKPAAQKPVQTSAGEQPDGIPNDMFAGAMALFLSGDSVSILDSNAAASKETGEPNHARNAGGKSVWFSFTPQANVTARIKTAQNSFDTLLAVYRGSNVAELTVVGYNDDCGNCSGGIASSVDLMLVGGQTYFIAVDGYNNGQTTAQGAFQLSITTSSAPAQDNLADAYDLGVGAGDIAGTTFQATGEAGEPNHYNQTYPGAKSVWYKWKATTTFSASFELTENFPSLLTVYTSNVASPTPNQLTKVTGSVDVLGFTSARYRLKFLAQENKTYYIAVAAHNAQSDAGNFQLKYTLNKFRYSTVASTLSEKTSLTVFRPASGTWHVLQAANNPNQMYAAFGQNGDTPVPADYIGQGATNFAVARNDNGLKFWYVKDFGGFQWGVSGDRAMTGDFDRDGRADAMAIRQTANGLNWYVRQSAYGNLKSFSFGFSTDKPLAGDFDGDGATDVAVVRSNAQTGLTWYVLRSGLDDNEGSYTQLTAFQFGAAGDKTVAEDYDGDGKTDFAVFRPSNGTWYVSRSSDNQLQVVQFGASSDVPQPGDYNGDGKAEPGVFRPSTGTWFTSTNPATNYGAVQWGAMGDIIASSMSSL